MPRSIEELRDELAELLNQKRTIELKLKDVDTGAPERKRLQAELKELEFRRKSLRVELAAKKP